MKYFVFIDMRINFYKYKSKQQWITIPSKSNRLKFTKDRETHSPVNTKFGEIRDPPQTLSNLLFM